MGGNNPCSASSDVEIAAAALPVHAAVRIFHPHRKSPTDKVELPELSPFSFFRFTNTKDRPTVSAVCQAVSQNGLMDRVLHPVEPLSIRLTLVRQF
jgi:hypothetical protein